MTESLTPLYYLIIPFIIVRALLTLLSRRYCWQDNARDERLLKQFRLELILLAGVLVVLLCSLPFFPGLASFGYPDSVSQIANQHDVLRYLQEYNQAIVRLAVVVFMLLIEMIIFVSLVYRYLKETGLSVVR